MMTTNQANQPTSYTLGAWLDHRGYVLDTPAKHLLARIVKRKFKEAFGCSPDTVTRINRWGQEVQVPVYPEHQLFILDASVGRLLDLKGCSSETGIAPVPQDVLDRCLEVV